MADYQCVAFFNAKDNSAGFSETYYYTGATYADANTAFTPLITARLAMMAPDMVVIFARISDVTIKGDSRIATLPVNPFGTFTDASGSEPLFVALLVRMEATEAYRGMREARAIPDGQIVGQIFIPSTPWTTAFNAWANLIVSNPWKLRTRRPPGSTPVYRSYTAVRLMSRVTHRAIGRPFGLPRGRRPTRAAT